MFLANINYGWAPICVTLHAFWFAVSIVDKTASANVGLMKKPYIF